MPKSRNRKKRRRHGNRLALPALRLDRILDGTIRRAFEKTPAEVVYHYTDWTAAEGILKTQRFWGTRHDCTNDLAELVSANDAIVEAAREVRTTVTGTAAMALDMFIKKYSAMQVAKQAPIFLACFSLARDDAGQWQRYGARGEGICLGVRILLEAPPVDRHFGGGMAIVDYSESSWRRTVVQQFSELCEKMRDQPPIRDVLAISATAFFRVAAFQAIRAKQADPWATEQEIRYFAVGRTPHPPQRQRMGRNGNPIWYTPLRVRNGRIALGEFIIGPAQDEAAGRTRAERLLSEAGYVPGTAEYPEIIMSAAVMA